MPAFSITLPPKMKNGTANSTNLLVADEKMRGKVVMIASIGLPEPSINIPNTLDTPRQIAIGVPSKRKTAKLRKIAGPIILPPPSPPRCRATEIKIQPR